MKNYYVYNNEALACCIFLNILKHIEKIDYARFFLILPYLMDDKTVDFLNENYNVDTDSFFKKSTLFFNYNARFLSLIPVAMNSLIILTDLGLVCFDENKNICLMDRGNHEFIASQRLQKINYIIPFFVNIISNKSTEYLYVNSGVEI